MSPIESLQAAYNYFEARGRPPGEKADLLTIALNQVTIAPTRAFFASRKGARAVTLAKRLLALLALAPLRDTEALMPALAAFIETEDFPFSDGRTALAGHLLSQRIDVDDRIALRGWSTMPPTATEMMCIAVLSGFDPPSSSGEELFWPTCG